MKKFSRANGWMYLRSYASGDGSISFVWVGDSDRNGPSFSEWVTESDVSEFIRQAEEEKSTWEGWDIVDVGGTHPHIKLARNVERPFHTSQQLTMEGKTYHYQTPDRRVESNDDGFHHTGSNTEFHTGGSTVPVQNDAVILALCFFLNNEGAFVRRDQKRKVG